MTTFYIREVHLETHSHSMSDWFWLEVETVAERPVFHAVEQRSGRSRPNDFWGVLVLSDTAPFDDRSERPAATHKQKLIFVRSRQGMAQARGGAHKYLGSFVCEYGFRWYVFRALPEEARRAADGTRPSNGASPSGSGPRGDSRKPRAPEQSNGSSAAKSGGTGPAPRT